MTIVEAKNKAQQEQTGKDFDQEWGKEFSRIVSIMERAAEIYAEAKYIRKVKSISSVNKAEYPEVKEGQPFVCDKRMYIIKTMDNATAMDNLENGQSIFILQPMD